MTLKQKVNWICQTCGQTFTRYSSGKRHNANLHSNMSLIVESTDYYVGITNGKYKPPDSPPASFRKRNSFKSNFLDIKIRNGHDTHHSIFNNQKGYDIDNHGHSNSKSDSPFNHFIPDNAALIDSIIEKYEQKLSPFLSQEEINKIINDWVILPLSTIIDSKESFYNYIQNVDNLVGYIRILKRRGRANNIKSFVN